MKLPAAISCSAWLGVNNRARIVSALLAEK